MNNNIELGQILYGGTILEQECSDALEGAIIMLSNLFDEILPEEDNPFSNTGAEYKNEVFEVIAYSWSDEEQPYNFKYKDVLVRWYKYAGRGMSCNREVSALESLELLNDCVNSLTMDF